MCAPLGAGMATLLGRKMFNKGEKAAGVNALVLGFMGISESAIPFLVRDTWRALIPNIIGSAAAGGIAYLAGSTDMVGAYGSFVVLIFGGVGQTMKAGGNIGLWMLWYTIAIIVGSAVVAWIYFALLLQKEGKFKISFIKKSKKQQKSTSNKEEDVIEAEVKKELNL